MNKTILRKTVVRTAFLALLTVALLLAYICSPLSAKNSAAEPRKGRKLVPETLSRIVAPTFPQRAKDADGFASIFDGKNLSGWRAVPAESVSDWTVRDGVLVGHGSVDRLSYLVWKDEHLTDFELKLRYRLPGKGNTGVEIRSRVDLTGKRPFEGYHADLGHVGIGPHVLGAWDFHFARRKEYPCPRGTQLIIDEDGKPHSSNIPGALTLPDIRPHQWNDVHIIARGNHFQFFINGKPASEFTDNAKSGRLDNGAIGLQIHDKGMKVEFKDIRLKRTEQLKLQVEQITKGSRHHFFGYIGQCQTIPWNASGRYVLGLEIDRIDRLPTPEEIIRLDKCHAWNPQQGTMFYWNPLKPETQFFFNDRDVKTGKVFTVLYDIEKKKRACEYKFDDTPVGNGGVAADGSAFLAINYGRLARLRLVTGYPEALDWSKDEIAPENDGIFIVDIKTGRKRLLVSYRQLEKELKKRRPELDHTGLFINHTLWNRDSDCVYFFVRGGWSKRMRNKGDKVNTPCSIKADGTGLTLHKQFIGGHPEWDKGNILIGRVGDRQVLYDMEKKKIVGQIGTPEMFPKPEGDISLSPCGDWFVNGYGKNNKNYYAVYRRSDGAFVRSKGIDKGAYSGDIRIDGAPRWNRTNDAILIPGIAKNKTRQMFVIRVITTGKSPKEN
jgi:hypothetical protein